MCPLTPYHVQDPSFDADLMTMPNKHLHPVVYDPSPHVVGTLHLPGEVSLLSKIAPTSLLIGTVGNVLTFQKVSFSDLDLFLVIFFCEISF